jgi:type I restriction enzyme, S subunit
MADKWRPSTWGGEISLEYGKALRGHETAEGPYRVFGSNGPIGWTAEPLTQGPGVILGRKGAYRGVEYSREPFFVIDTAYYVVPKSELDMRWLYYAIKHYKLGEVDDGSPIPSTTRAAVYMLDLDVPPQDEQRAIAHILGTLDDKIELNRRMNATLEAMARVLFKSWFVDFDPVGAKAEGRDPGLLKPLADLFPARLVDSELGEIPEGWEIGCVDDEFELTMGQSPPGDTYNETGEGLPFYQGRADFGSRFPTRRVYCTAPTRLAKAGDTLISVRAPVGDINMATEDCAIGRGVAAARHRSGSRSYSYQFMVGLQDVFGRFEAEGTVFGSIGKKDFHAISCARPPRAVIAEFEAMLAPIDSRIDVTERESRNLAGLRDALLPKLISGELRIGDAERFVGSVA